MKSWSPFARMPAFTPRVVQEATQWQTMVTYQSGMGVSLVPAFVQKSR